MVPRVLFDNDIVVTCDCRKWSELCGSTCVMSNALDITKWIKFHLSGGKNEAGHQIVDANSLAYIYRPRNVIMSSTVGKYFTKPKVPVTTTETSYGFGWKIGYYKGNTMKHVPILRICFKVINDLQTMYGT